MQLFSNRHAFKALRRVNEKIRPEFQIKKQTKTFLQIKQKGHLVEQQDYETSRQRLRRLSYCLAGPRPPRGNV